MYTWVYYILAQSIIHKFVIIYLAYLICVMSIHLYLRGYFYIVVKLNKYTDQWIV